MDLKKLTKEQLAEAAKCTTDEERKAFLSRNQIQLPEEMLDKVTGGNDSDGYECEECHAVFDSWWDLLIHTFSHVWE